MPTWLSGFAIGTSTVYRYLREPLEVLAAMSPTLAEAIEVAREKAYVIVDGTLLRIDRVGMTRGRDRPFYSGKHQCHGLNVQVLADPAGRLNWVSPALPGARYDMGAAREHGIIDAINAAGVRAVADTAYQGGGPAVRVPQRRRRPSETANPTCEPRTTSTTADGRCSGCARRTRRG